MLQLHSLVEFAAAVGAPLVTIGSFRGRAASVLHGGRARLASLIREAADHAAGVGVRLAVEPLNRYEADLVLNAQEGLEFLHEVGHPDVGLTLDTYHMNIEEASFEEPFIRAMLAGRLWHVHVGDNNRLPPGRGMIDFARVVHILREVGYDGFLSGELLPRPDRDTAARETIGHLRRLLDENP
jgi:sugar phosphate isomerase/epimerase